MSGTEGSSLSRFSYYIGNPSGEHVGGHSIEPRRSCSNCKHFEKTTARVTYHLSGKQARDHLPFYHCPLEGYWIMALREDANDKLLAHASDCLDYEKKR